METEEQPPASLGHVQPAAAAPAAASAEMAAATPTPAGGAQDAPATASTKPKTDWTFFRCAQLLIKMLAADSTKRHSHTLPRCCATKSGSNSVCVGGCSRQQASKQGVRKDTGPATDMYKRDITMYAPCHPPWSYQVQDASALRACHDLL